MKRTLLAIMAILIMLCSCQEQTNRASLRILLEKDTRTIAPEGYPLDVTKYRITGSGPGGASFDITTGKTSVSLTGLVIGTWSLRAEGLNENGDIMVYGETEFQLSMNSTSTTITLSTLYGSGSLSLSFSWDPARISSPKLDLTLTSQYGSKDSITLTPTAFSASEGTASFSGSGYPSGSYVLSARLYSGEVLAAGSVEAVRIAGNKTSTGSIAFDLDKYPDNPGSLNLVNQTGVPVSCSIEGVSDTTLVGNSVVASLASDSGDISGFQIQWYLDGAFIGEGISASFTPSAGVHRIDAVASTSRLGSSGSCGKNFETVLNTAEGIPVVGGVIRTSETSLVLGAKPVIRFLPDGKVLAISNAAKLVQICSLLRNTLSIEKTYTFEELGITAAEVKDVQATQLTEAASKLVMAADSPASTFLFNYSHENPIMIKSRESKGDYGVHSGTQYPIGSYRKILMLPLYDFAFILGHQADMGGSYLIAKRYLESTDAAYNAGSLNLRTSFHLALRSTPTVTAVNPEGSMCVVGCEAGGFYAYAPSRITDPYFKMEVACTVDLKNKTSGLRNMSFIGYSQIAFATATSIGVATASASNYQFALTSQQSIGERVVEDMKTTDDYAYTYIIDSAGNSVWTLKPNEDRTQMVGLGDLSLPVPDMNAIEISGSGTNALVYNRDSADSIVLLRINR
ncbi:MAG: hypothetical protein SPJ34_09405 [Candidatus Ornithospirochaeta sp.]|nr:hypothetical protein [Candidatus Ornithospirochaeta sp.]